MTSSDLAAELFDAERTAGIVASHIDIELGDFSSKERKRHHKRLDAFIQSLCECHDLESHTQQMINTGVIGVYWCETKDIAQAVIEDVYQRMSAFKKHDGYNCCALNSDIGFIEIWIDN